MRGISYVFYTDLPYPSSTVPLPLGLAQWEFLHPQRFIDTRLYNTFDTENFFLVDQTDFSNFCIVHNVCDAFSDGINIFKKSPQLSYIQVDKCCYVIQIYYVIHISCRSGILVEICWNFMSQRRTPPNLKYVLLIIYYL